MKVNRPKPTSEASRGIERISPPKYRQKGLLNRVLGKIARSEIARGVPKQRGLVTTHQPGETVSWPAFTQPHVLDIRIQQQCPPPGRSWTFWQLPASSSSLAGAIRICENGKNFGSLVPLYGESSVRSEINSPNRLPRNELREPMVRLARTRLPVPGFRCGQPGKELEEGLHVSASAFDLRTGPGPISILSSLFNHLCRLDCWRGVKLLADPASL